MTVGELRPLTAGRLLAIRQETADRARDALEAAALCNAAVLSESCYDGGARCFPDAEAVLGALTFREMERLVEALAGRTGPAAPAAVNPSFDAERFAKLREGA